MHRLGVVGLLIVSALSLTIAACEQGEGERCQIQADCASGLVCNQATGTCQSTASGTDGSIMPDAMLDAGPADANVDAMVDASPPDA